MFKYLILLNLVFQSSTWANPSERSTVNYAKNIEQLVKNGAITPNEGQQHLLKVKLSTSQEKKDFKSQVRSVASKINQIKIYQFDNSPIEIQSK